MKKQIAVLLLSFCPLLALAAGGSSYPMESANVDLSDKASLQRGAKYYVNYCMSCHALSYQRYNRMGRDIGLTDDEVIENLIFTHDDKGEPTKVGELMTIAMTKAYAKESFYDAYPPDLTLVARSRSADWVYNYLKTFYLDDSRPFGVNNAVFENVGMPHVLWQLQGWQKAIYKEENGQKVIDGFEIVKPGSMSVEEYDQLALDLTNFLVYTAEPAKLVRHKVGAWVLVFLFIFAIVAYALKKEYWRDVK